MTHAIAVSWALALLTAGPKKDTKQEKLIKQGEHLVAYLQSLAPIKNAVPEPMPPSKT